jgi:hypothetical protein
MEARSSESVKWLFLLKGMKSLFVEAGSPYVTQAGLELKILLVCLLSICHHISQK